MLTFIFNLTQPAPEITDAVKTPGNFKFKQAARFRKDQPNVSTTPQSEQSPMPRTPDHVPLNTNDPALKPFALHTMTVNQSSGSGNSELFARNADCIDKSTSHLPGAHKGKKVQLPPPEKAVVILPDQTRIRIPYDIDFHTFEQELFELLQPTEAEANTLGFIYRINGASEYSLKENFFHKFLERMQEAKLYGPVIVQVRIDHPVYIPHIHPRKLTHI